MGYAFDGWYTMGNANHHILVAEDSSVLRLVLQRTFRVAGFRVITAVDGLDAWRQAERNDIPFPQPWGATNATRRHSIHKQTCPPLGAFPRTVTTTPSAQEQDNRTSNALSK